MVLELVAGVVVWVAAITTSLLVSPRLSRPDIFFSVVVEPSFPTSPEGRAILRGYRGRVCLGAFVVLVTAFVAFEWLGRLAAVFWPLGLVIWAIPVFLRARRFVQPHAVTGAQSREALLGPREPLHWQNPLLELLPWLFLIVTAAWLATHWSELPERFPVHFDLYGHPNRWATRSYWSVSAPLWIAALPLLLLVGLRSMMRRLPRLRVTGAAATQQAHLVRRISQLTLALEYLLAVVFSCIALRPVLQGSMAVVGLGSMLGSLAFVVVLLIVVARSRRATPALGGDGTSDRFWKGGLLYVNPGDPALWVERRFGFGWTLNFGRRLSWLILALILAVPLAALLIAHLATSH